MGQQHATGWPGWWWPPTNSKKAHYFKPEDRGRSLCQSYRGYTWVGSIAAEAEDNDDDLPTNCPSCRKLVKAMRNAQPATSN